MSSRPVRSGIRSGLTLVEVMAALVIVSVGLLGMAGASTLSRRVASAAARELGALRRLELRLASLSAAGCARASSGAHDDPTESVRESWTVDAPSSGVVLVDATARWSEGGRPRVLTLRSALLC